MSILQVNGHIAYLHKRFDQYMKTGEKEVDADVWDGMKLKFADYSHRKLLTQYVQERLYMLNRYDMSGMVVPRDNIKITRTFEESIAMLGGSTVA